MSPIVPPNRPGEMGGSEAFQSLPAGWWDVDYRAEETVRFVVWSSRKEQRGRQPVGAARVGAVTELKRPQTIDLDRLSARGVH